MATNAGGGVMGSDSNLDKSKLESVLSPFHAAESATWLDGSKQPNRGSLRFGPFELRIDTRELSKCGARVKLQTKSAQILEALVSRPEELVRREELCALLWPGGVFVDFDSGLNTAVNRLRTALGDTAESPLYIETIPRLGYRFICPVLDVSTESPEPDTENGHEIGKTVFMQADVPGNASISKMLWRLAIATVLALACEFFFLRYAATSVARLALER